MKSKRIAIFGAGITGLAAGRELVRAGHRVQIFEASDHVGGLASTYKDADGFVYDNGPRFMFSTLAEKIGIAHLCEPVHYYEELYVNGTYYRFPFGFVRSPRFCLSVATAMLTRGFRPRPTNLQEFLFLYYGETFSKAFLRPLIEKWAGVPATEVSIDFASRLLPTNIAYILYSLVKKLRRGVTEDYYKKGRYIVYPRGSNSVIFETLLQTPGLKVHLNRPLTRLVSKDDRIVEVIVGKQSIQADYFISTIPITNLAQFLSDEGKVEPWKTFHYRGIMLLFIKLNRPSVFKHLWTWFPSPSYRFYRISEFKNARRELAPPDKTLLAVEFACQPSDAFWELSAEEVLESIRDQLQSLYGIRQEEILGLDLRHSPYAYPVLLKRTEVVQREMQNATPWSNLFVAGRTGMHQYRMLEGSFASALDCVEALQRTITGDQVRGSKTVARDAYGRPLFIPE